VRGTGKEDARGAYGRGVGGNLVRSATWLCTLMELGPAACSMPGTGEQASWLTWARWLRREKKREKEKRQGVGDDMWGPYVS
jgi:hypothetical protein